MPELSRLNASIYYETFDGGIGPWVTLINGFTRSSQDFKSLGRRIASQGGRALSFDNRGAGKTESPTNFIAQDIVDDVFYLWDQLNVEASHVLGISYGGILSQLLTAQATDRVLSLCLVSTAPSSAYIFKTNQMSEPTPEQVEAYLKRYVSSGWISKNPMLFGGLVKATRKAFEDPKLRENTLAQRQALGEFNHERLLRELKPLPVLVLHGAEDQIIDPAAVAAFKSLMPYCETKVFEGIGHLLLAEMPHLFFDEVIAFQARVSESSQL